MALMIRGDSKFGQRMPRQTGSTIHYMPNKLYIGNLSFGTTEQDLREAFASAGTVTDAVVITDKMTGRSRGFGFVTMTTDDEAQEAIRKFNGQQFDGRSITVNEARPKEGGAPSGPRRGGGDHRRDDRRPRY